MNKQILSVCWSSSPKPGLERVSDGFEFMHQAALPFKRNLRTPLPDSSSPDFNGKWNEGETKVLLQALWQKLYH